MQRPCDCMNCSHNLIERDGYVQYTQTKSIQRRTGDGIAVTVLCNIIYIYGLRSI